MPTWSCLSALRKSKESAENDTTKIVKAHTVTREFSINHSTKQKVLNAYAFFVCASVSIVLHLSQSKCGHVNYSRLLVFFFSCVCFSSVFLFHLTVVVIYESAQLIQGRQSVYHIYFYKIAPATANQKLLLQCCVHNLFYYLNAAFVCAVDRHRLRFPKDH